MNVDWGFYGIVYNGVWLLIYSVLLAVPFVPYLRMFAGTSRCATPHCLSRLTDESLHASLAGGFQLARRSIASSSCSCARGCCRR
jgi:hypothetical protein